MRIVFQRGADEEKMCKKTWVNVDLQKMENDSATHFPYHNHWTLMQEFMSIDESDRNTNIKREGKDG